MSHIFIPITHLDSLLNGKKLMRRELRAFIAIWQCLSEFKKVQPIPERTLRKALRIKLQDTELRSAFNKLKRLGAVPESLTVEWDV